MNRKDFLAAAATLGGCVCTGALLHGAEPARIDNSPEAKELRGKIDFMQKRMARLIRALDEPTRQQVLETMGRECAKESGGLIGKYRGQPQEFLNEARRLWAQETSYEATSGEIRVVDRATHCTCAFVQPGVTPADFCACTLGWQKEAYATILGEPVDAELEESILRGGTQCAFRIRPRRGSPAAG